MAAGACHKAITRRRATVKRIARLIPLVLLLGGCVTAAPTAGSQPPQLASATIAAIESAPDLADRLRGLDFDTFLEHSFRELMLRAPENLVETGLDRIYGVTDVRLTDVSDGYARETQQMQQTILEALRGFDREALSADQRLSFDVYAWSLDDLLRGAPYQYHSYPVAFMINSRHAQTLLFFTEIHPLATRHDAETYVARMELLGRKIDQLVEALAAREREGIVPPRLVLDWTVPEIARIAVGPATVTPYYLTLEHKIEGIRDLDEAGRRELLAGAEHSIGSGVVPAYGRLGEALRRLAVRASG